MLVTHEPDIAEYAHRVVHIRDGQIFSDEPSKRFRNERLTSRESHTTIQADSEPERRIPLRLMFLSAIADEIAGRPVCTNRSRGGEAR